MCEQKSQQNFIAKKREKKAITKKNVPKTSVEHSKNNGQFYLYWAPNFKKILKKLPTHMGPIFAHVCPCVNDEFIKSELKMN
jgi:hypothetical protein